MNIVFIMEATLDDGSQATPPTGHVGFDADGFDWYSQYVENGITYRTKIGLHTVYDYVDDKQELKTNLQTLGTQLKNAISQAAQDVTMENVNEKCREIVRYSEFLYETASTVRDIIRKS